MTTYTWPATRAMLPQSCELRVVDNLQRAHESPLSGYTQTQAMPGARWGWMMNWPDQAMADRDVVEAFLLKLAGRQHRVRIWDFRRPQPLGDIALSGVTLGASAAQFATSLQLAGCRSRSNLIAGGGFEVADGGTGRGVGWSAYSAGSSAGVAYSLMNGPWAGMQRVQASSLGGSSSDQLGIALAAMADVSAGTQYSVAADMLSVDASHQIAVGFYTAGLGYLGGGATSAFASTGTYNRRTLTATAPAGAAKMQVWIYMLSGTGAAPELRVDQVQVNAGAPQAYAEAALKAGDWLGLASGQLVRVVDDAAAVGGAMTVEVRHMLRSAVASGSAVMLDKPTALYMRTQAGIALQRQPGGTAPGFADEFVEAFA